MRNILRITIVVLVAIGVSLSMYFVADLSARSNNANRGEVTATKPAVTEKYKNRKLLAEVKGKDYRLYKQNNLIILKHGGKEFTFENWSKYIDLEPPQMVLSNFDNDKEPEVLVRVIGDISKETGEKVYQVYVLNESKNESTGEFQYFVTLLSRNTWLELFNERVNVEVSQLDYCDKIIQFAMCMSNESINYDRETGLANSYYYCFRALQDKNGKYLKVDKWNKGVGNYVLEEDGIKIYVPIYLTYENSDIVQQAGYVKATIVIWRDSYQPEIRNHSMSFVANKEYMVHPRKYATDKTWKSVEKNSNTTNYSTGDNIIDYIVYKTEPNDEGDSAKMTNFATNDTELNKISQIEITESYIELVAKSGYTFDEKKAKISDFKIILVDPERPDKEYDIAYYSEISKNGDGDQVLRLNFDKKYAKENIRSLEIQFGAN